MAGKTSKNSAKGTSKAKPESPSSLIDAGTRGTTDWRDEMLSRIRSLITQAVPEVTEEMKWKKPSNPLGVPVWSHDGMICTGETYKDKVKLTFAKGASLEDPTGIFNASLEANTRRAIDIYERDEINESAFKALVRNAAALNAASRRTPSKAKPKAVDTEPKLLSGGNPQIAKGDGDAPVQAYIAAMPGWKSDAGRNLDALIERTVPDVKKAVRWNSPFYGMEGQGWFLAYHCFTKYIKVTFLRGTSLSPLPPVESKDPDTRYFHIYEDKEIDEAQLADWVKQASELPGWGNA